MSDKLFLKTQAVVENFFSLLEKLVDKVDNFINKLDEFMK